MQVLIITNRCNFKCRHCIREGATSEDLDHALLRDALPVLRASGVRRLILTGGEPILHPRFETIVDLLVSGGFELGIVSNGWYYRRYLELLRPFRKQIAYLALSLDSHRADEHDRVRARRGIYERVFEAIDAFQQAGYR
ncbi:MAG: radical SAM protein, partial [Candidatus Thiodiazotropha sp.]